MKEGRIVELLPLRVEGKTLCPGGLGLELKADCQLWCPQRNSGCGCGLRTFVSMPEEAMLAVLEWKPLGTVHQWGRVASCGCRRCKHKGRQVIVETEKGKSVVRDAKALGDSNGLSCAVVVWNQWRLNVSQAGWLAGINESWTD